MKGEACPRRHDGAGAEIQAAVRAPEPEVLAVSERSLATGVAESAAGAAEPVRSQSPEGCRGLNGRRWRRSNDDPESARRGGFLGRFQVHGQRMSLTAGDRHDLPLLGVARRADDDLRVARGSLIGN